MILVDGYYFTRHAASGGKMRYRCCKYNIGCTACLYTLLDDSAVVLRPTFFTTEIGARIMKLRGYCYTRHSVCSSRVKWLCVENRTNDCHAIVVTIGYTMVDRQNKHTHPPNLT
ncbi:hypothetical protein RR48_05202 [Papilio machaon]|uniref:FLYWCH-type domain-containing protein n=1 Tax=Papilio machaon TaxID=76193 RepID=A0A0N1IH16_PAPMA|nr:hypothetical protein RR48_05202 [Papilio machaon]